jgi:tetrachlorobenzoquinone reductase
MLAVHVAAVTVPATNVRALELIDPTGAELPSWTPGAHVDVKLPGGILRQYSLCSDPQDLTRYRIAVLRVQPPGGRGGSCWIHDELGVGDTIEIGAPRNNFALREAEEYLFLAGGIGITPLVPMIVDRARAGARWKLVYGARDRAHMALVDELTVREPGRVTLMPEDEAGRIDVPALLLHHPYAAIYCCGPEAMLAAVSAACSGRELHVERFTASATSGMSDNHPFEVELARSARRIHVAADQTILAAMRDAGLDPECSCEQGICGTCEMRVLSGAVDHRDELLTDAERAASDTMMPCVSRAAGDLLVLDA